TRGAILAKAFTITSSSRRSVLECYFSKQQQQRRQFSKQSIKAQRRQTNDSNSESLQISRSDVVEQRSIYRRRAWLSKWGAMQIARICDPKSLLFIFGMQLDFSDALIGGAPRCQIIEFLFHLHCFWTIHFFPLFKSSRTLKARIIRM
ncbi:hypothetical protein M8C21_009804, partial [Ambrosia artemisiifolia]